MPSSHGNGSGRASPRSFALVGPQGSGKSTLFEALLAATAAAPPLRLTYQSEQPRLQPAPRVRHS